MAQLNLRRKELPLVSIDYARSLGITDDEWKSILVAMGRAPNEYEVLMFAMLWAENTSQKSSDLLLKGLRDSQAQCFAEHILYSTRSPFRMVELDEEYAVLQYAGHSNAETAKSPAFGGALALNYVLDEFITLGAKPLTFCSLLRIGDHERPKTQKDIQHLMNGISRYANIFGLSVINGDLYFHPSFNYTVCSNFGALGIVKKNYLNALTEKPPVDSPLMAVGYRTPPAIRGEDGKSKAVRIADPFMQHRMLEICREGIECGYISDICPLSRGGIIKATFTLAGRLESGIQLYVDKIPMEVRGMELNDLLIDETSGRFLIVVRPEHHRSVSDLFSPHGIDCVTVGLLSGSDDVELVSNHMILGNAPYRFANNGYVRRDLIMNKCAPMLHREELEIDDSFMEPLAESIKLEDVWVDILANPNLCSRHPATAYFDRISSASEIIRNGGDAAVFLLPRNAKSTSQKGLALSIDANSLFTSVDTYMGTVHSIAEALQNLACVGARPCGLSFCLNVGDPDDPLVRAQLSEAVRAFDDTSSELNIPILSEAVSSDIGGRYITGLPTPGVMVCGIVSDVSYCVNHWFQDVGDKVFLLGVTNNDLACSEYAYQTYKQVAKVLPDLNLHYHEGVCTLVASLVREGFLQSAHDLSSGGLCLALSECCITRPKKPIGATLDLKPHHKGKTLRREEWLFSETPGRFLVSCQPQNEEALRAMCAEYGVQISAEGEVTGRDISISGIISCSIPAFTARRIWINGLNHLFDLEEKDEDFGLDFDFDM
ncbi:MAG: hypothetical protein IT292_08330 [Deltaproteobacteria bacterium]|nr:hypothetical protein [Deltaproteobacteria bacterium]